MNLAEIIDILLIHIYKDKNSNCLVSEFLISKGYEYNSDNSDIVCGKINELNLFKTIDVSTNEIGADYILNSNIKGVEFVKKYETYSNFLNEQKLQNEIENQKLREKEQREIEAHQANLTASKAALSSQKSSWASFVVAVITTLFAIFQYFESNELNDKYDKVIKHIDSLQVSLKEMKFHTKGQVDSSKVRLKKK